MLFFEITPRGVFGIIYYNMGMYGIFPLKDTYHIIYKIDHSKCGPDDLYSYNSKISYNPIKTSIIPKTTQYFDVLALYTPGARIAADPFQNGDPYYIKNIIQSAYNQANQVYDNSNVPVRIGNIVKEEINYSSVSHSIDIDRLINPSDGYMDNVHSLRTNHGSDIVILFKVGGGSAAGQAAKIWAEADSAFAVVRYNSATTRYSFVHEIGHLFGAEHEWFEEGPLEREYPVLYNHGYTDPNEQYQTLMAASKEGTIFRIPFLSEDRTVDYGGTFYLIGEIPFDDVARLHSERASTIANFYDPPILLDISGPTFLAGNNGTFTANASGGTTPYTNYQWWYRNDGTIGMKAPPVGTWIYISQYEGQSSIIYGPNFCFSLKCIVTDSNNKTAEDIHSVTVIDGLKKGASDSNNSIIPSTNKLKSNYPNPFNPSTTIEYDLSEDSDVILTVMNISGHIVKEWEFNGQNPGTYRILWDGRRDDGQELTSGMYIYQLKTSNFSDTKKMVYMK